MARARSPNNTFYDIKRLHRWFACSALALVAATLWVLLVDHCRPWKRYQRTFRDTIEPWTTAAALRQEQTDAKRARDPQELAQHRAACERLERTLAQQTPNLGKRLLRLPLIEALGRPVAIQQIWLPGLTIDYHFCQVARFDRCTTCHLGIDKTVWGSPQEPAYLPEEDLKVQLSAEEAPARSTQSVLAAQPTLEDRYGLGLAPRGMLDPRAVTIGLVVPQSPAARAGLLPGDVILQAGARPIQRADQLQEILLASAAQGQPVEIQVRRGLPHPYRSHPRLDLFVSPASPHPMAEFGCTICHDGQGSATEFKFASHWPDGPGQRAEWRTRYGWFGSPDWDFPMRPRRYLQSNCLKCHHQVSDLEPSRRFADPPAPKLLAGYDLVRRYGCFGCHEIHGMSGLGRRIGPDMRLEPAYHEAAEQLLADPALSPELKALAGRVIAQPENAQIRRQLLQGLAGVALGPTARAMVALLDTEPAFPGTLRKVGPSLRGISAKLDARMLQSWIAEPASFRPDTRMPQLFGMHEHLDPQGLQQARRFEPVEVRAIAEYLLDASQPVSPLPVWPDGEKPSAERGKRLFGRSGCLACHRHADFPEGQATHGPDLSRMGAKLDTQSGRAWLVSWLRDPARHSPRTLMPNLLLEPEASGPAAGKGRTTAPADSSGAPPTAEPARASRADPAADLAAYLLGWKGWEPKDPPPLIEADLDALALLYLARTFPAATAKEYLAQGIPSSMAQQVPPEGAELVAPISLRKKLRYVGRQTIRRRGCFGCHDIPGFEGAEPIGPPLADWGRKAESLLAFQQVQQLLEQSQGQFPPASGAPAASPPPETDPDRQFYLAAIRARRREGFLWQKLRAPRSFDYLKTATKGYDEQLRMGRFGLTEAQREAIITFVLGLVAEPPNERYLAPADPRSRAIAEGRKLLDQYACGACHTLQLERWTVDFDPAKTPAPPTFAEYPFLKPQVTPQQLAASKKTDRRGLCRVELVGMPQPDAQGKPAEVEDEEGNPVYAFVLWEPAVIAGQVWPAGGAPVLVWPGQIVQKRPAIGGDFARLLFSAALGEARAADLAAGPQTAWGWLPPPLAHIGRAVQPAWLYDYLLEPTVIRPASILRMPKYNLSPAEASALVNYFAATAGAEFPFDPDPQGRAARVAARPQSPPARWQQALRLVLDQKTFCAKCHLVGDYGPGGESPTLGPNLERVATRLRAEHLRRWLANPRALLPYTTMPVNFPIDRSLGQDLLPGTSAEQLDAVIDLLLNYDQYIKSRVSIGQLIDAAGQK
ncbi:MAG: PDZ domain-containing protein [Thermoguttaceae bacterium]